MLRARPPEQKGSEGEDPMPAHEVAEARDNGLRRYFAPIAVSVAGPTVFSVYVFAFWSLAADIGLTHSFPWSADRSRAGSSGWQWRFY
jgi:hypothetical protein